MRTIKKATTKKVAQKKVVKKISSTRTAKAGQVMVGRFGQDPVAIKVTGDSNVKSVLSQAEISLSGSEHVWLNGERASGTSKVKPGDIISIVSPRQAGV